MPMNHRLLRPRASGFNPKSISGLSLWLDASDASTITLNGANVSEWRDKSGGSPNASQATAASQPAYTSSAINGRPAVDFNSNRSLVFASSTASFNYLHNSTGGTIFMVVRPGATSDPNAYRPFLTNHGDSSANTGVGFVFDDRAAGFNRNNMLIATVNRGVAGQQTAAVLANNFFTTANAYCVLSVAFDCGNATASSRLRVYLNGTANGTTNTSTNAAATGNASQNMTIGSIGGGTEAAVAEMLFYQGVLGASQRVAVERYLAKKYGIAVA